MDTADVLQIREALALVERDLQQICQALAALSECHALSTAFIVASGALRSACDTLAGLEIQENTMRQNLDKTSGLIVAEAVMMGLAPKMGRQQANDCVYDCYRTSLETGQSFLSALLENQAIATIASREELVTLVNPKNYIGSAPEIVFRYLQQWPKTFP